MNFCGTAGVRGGQAPDRPGRHGLGPDPFPHSAKIKTRFMHPLDPVWQSVVREFDQAQALSRQEARCETTKHLNQIVRRLSHYESESDWLDAVLDGICAFAPQAAVFSVESGGQLQLRGSRHLALAADLAFSTSSAAAFADAIESKDTVVVLRTQAEVGEDLASERSGGNPGRCYLLPIRNRTRIAALIFALEHVDPDLLPNRMREPSPVHGPNDPAYPPTADINALELIASASSAMLERVPKKTDLLGIAPSAEAPAPKPSLPSWADLDEAERSLHIRAQRFARTKVAEMQLFKPEICRKGNESQDLYLYLKPEIDSAREAYRTQFMNVRSMVDYLHIELSTTLAHGNELLLGTDYPGQMV